MDPDSKLVLIVWEEFPEETTLVVREVNETELEQLQSWHGKYINGEGEPDGMYEYFYGLVIDENGEDRMLFRFQKITDFLHEVKYDSVVRMGIIS